MPLGTLQAIALRRGVKGFSFWVIYDRIDLKITLRTGGVRERGEMNESGNLDRIEQRLMALEREVEELRRTLEQEKKASLPKEEIKSLQTVLPVPNSVPVVQRQEQKKPEAPKKTAAAGFEEKIGGRIMGIVAAVLVFVGLLLFGTALYERLGDTARMGLLFTVSFLLLGAGLWFGRRRQSWFTVSLTGCGFGAVYISLFITALYFRQMNAEMLYLLLFLWLAGVGLYVFWRRSYTVALLGQAGTAFSVIFGSFWVETTGLYNFLCVYFFLISQLYLWVVLWRFLPAEKEKPYPWIHSTAAGLNVLQLLFLTYAYNTLFGRFGELGGKNWFGGVLLCLYCFLLPVFFLLRQRLLAGVMPYPRRRERRLAADTLPFYRAAGAAAVFYGIYQLLCCIVFYTVATGLFAGDSVRCLWLLAGLSAVWLLCECFGFAGTEGGGACVVTLCAVLFATGELSWGLRYLVPAVFAVITACFGLFGKEYPVMLRRDEVTGKWTYVCREYRGRWLEKFAAVLYLPLLDWQYSIGDGWGRFWFAVVFGVLVLTGCMVFLYRKGERHRFADAWKKELYLCGLFQLFWMTSVLCESVEGLLWLEEQTVLLTVLALGNGAAFYGGLCRRVERPGEKDRAALFLTRGIQSALWIWGMVLLRSVAGEEKPFLCVWLLLLTLYLCGSGMREQYQTYQEKKGLGVYFGVKATIYLLAALTAFEGIEGYVVSCALLLLAIAAVLAGFPLRLAPLRVYGLCLAMFAVVKLLMADLKHDNSMETVLCFLGAGVLCFGINFIYNHVKRRFTENE